MGLLQESDLRDMICEKLKTRDGRIDLKKMGMMTLPSGIPYSEFNLGEYGRADIVDFYISVDESPIKIPKEEIIGDGHQPFFAEKLPFVCAKIYELKAVKSGVSHVLQLLRYMRAVDRLLYNLVGRDAIRGYQIIGELVTPEYATNCDSVYIPEFFDNIRISTYKIDLSEGTSFKYIKGYKLVEENLNYAGFLKNIIEPNAIPD